MSDLEILARASCIGVGSVTVITEGDVNVKKQTTDASASGNARTIVDQPVDLTCIFVSLLLWCAAVDAGDHNGDSSPAYLIYF